MPIWERRTIGRTSVEVTELGLGPAARRSAGTHRGLPQQAEAHRRGQPVRWGGFINRMRPRLRCRPRPSVCVGDAMPLDPRATEWVAGSTKKKVGRLPFALGGPQVGHRTAASACRSTPSTTTSDDGVMRSFEDSFLQRSGCADRPSPLVCTTSPACQHGRKPIRG